VTEIASLSGNILGDIHDAMMEEYFMQEQ